jgi:hypothetical protein
MVSDPRELCKFLATPGIEIINLMFASDEFGLASWRFHAEENIPSLRHTNEVMGTYVTTGARMHLYKYLDRLEESDILRRRFLYFTFRNKASPV